MVMKIKSATNKKVKPSTVKGFVITGNCEDATSKLIETIQKDFLPSGGFVNCGSTLDEWLAGIEIEGGVSTREPGRLSLLLTNCNDNFQTWFWRPEEPNKALEIQELIKSKLGFIFVYSSPLEVLNANKKNADQLFVDINEQLNRWRKETELLLSIYQHNPDRCLIVSADTTTATEISLINLNKKFHLSFKQGLSDIATLSDNSKAQFERIVRNEDWVSEVHRQAYQSMLLDVPPPSPTPVTMALAASADPASGQGLAKSVKLSATDYSGIGNELLELQDENRELTHKIHAIQEKFEQKITLNQEYLTIINRQRTALEKIHSKFPDYWSVDAVTTKASAASNALELRLVNAEIGYTNVEEISLNISLEEDLPSISIKQTTSPWLRCMENSDREWLTIAPTPGGIYQGTNTVISHLGPTDWASIQELVNKLSTYVNSEVKKNTAPAKTIQLQNTLNKIKLSLQGWPMIPRYDHITLKDTLQDGGYRSLGITLSNLTIGDSKWGKLFYRLATLDDVGVTFGTNPRLEFPQESKSAMQNWFPESDDGRGQRLELRFAKPDAMDLQVWSALAENDKLLIAGLISSLDKQLNELARSAELVKTDWAEWHILAQSIRQIAARKIISG